ncbi:uncharacterized protein LOC117528724 [Thalassophryne amazonica]|uniref:uncharacterized protein LOC117528724 n=1 Tax=Thalassophryne amazonica TaxID=390379 RepID=UPI001471188A|nr:uncharacterized protein LOC117528724 [Thalassophryne amazonica]
MDLVEYGDISNGCEDENYGLVSGFLEDCSNHTEYQGEEPGFGLIELVCVTVVYIPLMLLGLLGNILTILVVWLRPHMRTSTYLYLSSMAVSDLLILLLLPLDLYKLWRPRPWPFGDLACKLTMFVSECCTYCTILHITFLSLERYLAVCWPIMAKTFVTRRKTRTLIGCLWLGAAVSAAPVLVMVGVEDVGGEEAELWVREEDTGWTSTAGKKGGLAIVGDVNEQFASVHGELEREKGWGEGVTEMKWFRKERERNIEPTELQIRKQKEGEETYSDIQNKTDVGGGQEREGKIRGKEEMEGGEDESFEATRRGVMDNRECRCFDYAISSGLLSAMMILSNLYFLISLCILGVVYGLIGRTLWLRPQINRREPSHRHTIKMLGVIVLAFVLCWLPFHIGRTLLSFSQGTGTDGQEVPMELYADTGTLSDTNIVISTNKSSFTAQSDSDKHGRTVSGIVVNTDADAQRELPKCDVCVKTQVKNNTYMVDMSMHADNGTRGSITRINTHADTLYYLSQYFKLVSSVLFYLSAAVNPLLYNLMSVRYRLAVHSLVCMQPHSHAQRLRTFTVTTHTTTITTTTTTLLGVIASVEGGYDSKRVALSAGYLQHCRVDFLKVDVQTSFA